MKTEKDDRSSKSASRRIKNDMMQDLKKPIKQEIK